MAGLINGTVAGRLRVQEFRASGTFNVPAGVKTVGLFMVGGGGGGGGSFNGQGGNVVEINYDVAGKASCAVVIGAGGAASSSGGDTSFDGVAFARGGATQGTAASGTVAPAIGEAGRCGFGGHGGTGNQCAPCNGAVGVAAGPANTGAGGSNNFAGGSGYLRVEWYE